VGPKNADDIIPRNAELPRETGPLKGLTANVLRLGWVSLFADISSEMLYPIVPVFLTSVLGAPVSTLGVIEGVAEAIASLLKSTAGAMSDASGKRKPYVFSGYVVSAVARPIIGLATGWGLVLFSRSLDRLGKALRSAPRDALLADSVSAEYRGKAFCWHRGMDTVGAIVGPLLALWLISALHDNLRVVFVVAFIPGMVGALFVLLVKEKTSAPKPRAASSERLTVRFSTLSANFKAYLYAWGIFSAGNSSDMFLLLRAHELGFSNTMTVLLYVFYNIVYAVASPWLGQLSDRVGRKHVLISGLAVFALVYAGFAFATAHWQIWVLYGTYGLYIAATDGVGKALAVDLVEPEVRAGAIGLLGTVTGIATLIASSVAGLLWTTFGSQATFAYGAVAAALACLFIWFKIRIEPTATEAH
jgi:MFS family permease